MFYVFRLWLLFEVEIPVVVHVGLVCGVLGIVMVLLVIVIIVSQVLR